MREIFKKIFNIKDTIDKKVSKTEDNNSLSRRDFLKKTGEAAFIASTAISTNYVLDEALKLLEDNEVKAAIPPSDNRFLTKEIDQENLRTIDDIFKFDQKYLLFTKDTHIEIKEYWKKEFKKYPQKIKEAFAKMKNWKIAVQKEFLEIFKEEIDQKIFDSAYIKSLAYLGIAESYFDLDAVSFRNAKGPFQFLKNTAKDYGLIINEAVDERIDPIKSARACAKMLKDYFYKSSPLEDPKEKMRLSLCAYNGGFFNRFRKESGIADSDIMADDFYKYITQKLNKNKKEAENYRRFHKVSKRETLRLIALKYRIDIEVIMRENNLKTDRLKEGQILFLPTSKSEKEKYFKEVLLSDIIQNMNYVGKFEAVVDLSKNFDKENDEIIKWNEVRAGQIKNQIKTKKISLESVKKLNPGVKNITALKDDYLLRIKIYG